MANIATEELEQYALKHTVTVVTAAMAEDPDAAIRDAYLVLASQRLTAKDTAQVIDMTLGNVLGILREVIPEGTLRTHLTHRMQAVGSYAALLDTMQQISGGNRASRRKKGRKK